MALTIGDNFSYMGAKPLDGRLKYDTVASMKAMADSVLYDGCLAYCVATDKTYQWKSTNDVDATLGKWREFESGGSDNVVEGYYKEADGKFYEEDTYETEIVGEDKVLYISLDTNLIYRWDGSEFVIMSSEPENQTIDYEDFEELPQSEKDNGTAYFVPDVNIESGIMVFGNRFDKANIYTADERMVGSWMGKPLYQRTVDCGAGPNATTKSVPCSINNLDKIVDIKGIICSISTSDIWFKQVGNADSSPLYINIDYNNGNIRLNSGNNYSNGNVCVTLQYTKTSDGIVSVGTGNDYSTDEQIIGTWIDGKKLYQKTIADTVTVDNNDSRHAITLKDLTALNIDTVVNLLGTWSDSGMSVKQICCGDDYVFTPRYFMTSKTLQAIVINLKNEVIPYNITLQYTKTED